MPYPLHDGDANAIVAKQTVTGALGHLEIPGVPVFVFPRASSKVDGFVETRKCMTGILPYFRPFACLDFAIHYTLSAETDTSNGLESGLRERRRVPAGGGAQTGLQRASRGGCESTAQRARRPGDRRTALAQRRPHLNFGTHAADHLVGELIGAGGAGQVGRGKAVVDRLQRPFEVLEVQIEADHAELQDAQRLDQQLLLLIRILFGYGVSRCRPLANRYLRSPLVEPNRGLGDPSPLHPVGLPALQTNARPTCASAG